jgi:2-methylisocitrate lyase-like PEP mutase family enzyme
MDTRKRLLWGSDSFVVAPGIYDALGARIAERSRFEAVYMTGFGTTASMIATPDLGLLTMTEMVTHARQIVSAVTIPVIADADTGYGGIANLTRTVVEYEKTGVAAIHLEDQDEPKRCVHMACFRLIDREAMVKKLRCALAARSNEEMLIIGRTDAARCLGVDEAIVRGQLYAEAGVDLIFVDGLSHPDEYERVARSIQTPLLAAIVEASGAPKVSMEGLRQMGYRVVIFPVSTLFAVAQTLSKVMREIKATGTTGGIIGELMDYHSFIQLMGMEQFVQHEEMYGSNQEKPGC